MGEGTSGGGAGSVENALPPGERRRRRKPKIETLQEADEGLR